MKYLMITLISIAFQSAFAVEVNCTATDSNGFSTEINHDLNLNAHGPLDNIQGSDIASAFISSSNGHLVFNITDINTGVNLSTIGSPVEGKMVEALAQFGPSTWFKIQCNNNL